LREYHYYRNKKLLPLLLSIIFKFQRGDIVSTNKADFHFEVLSPWADADPIQLRGLTAPRLTDLNGKKIGLIHNIKRAAKPILTVVESKLKERYPKTEFSIYGAKSMSVAELEPQNINIFREWIQGVDAVILMVGD
jgi:hypothetical protein